MWAMLSEALGQAWLLSFGRDTRPHGVCPGSSQGPTTQDRAEDVVAVSRLLFEGTIATCHQGAYDSSELHQQRRDLSRVFMTNGCADTFWHSVLESRRFRVPAFDVDDSDTPWHPQFDEYQFLSQFSAALALGAFVQLCRSIGTHCSRRSSSHNL